MSGEIQVWLKCRHREKMVRKEAVRGSCGKAGSVQVHLKHLWSEQGQKEEMVQRQGLLKNVLSLLDGSTCLCF